MDDIELQENSENSEKLLGCHIQSNLKWTKQVSKTLSKLQIRLAGLMKIQRYAPLGIRKNLAEGLFNSVLVYCLPLYGGMSKGDINNLQIMQNKAACMVAALPPRSNRVTVFNKVEWLTVQQLVFYHTVVLVFKIRQK